MMKRQKACTPKSRCEIRLPTDLEVRLDKISAKSGTTRTALMIAAIERFVYGEETATGVETIHERVAVLTVGQDQMQSDLLEVRAYLDALAQKLCNGSEAEFDRFLGAVEKVKSELVESAE
jgi:predicted DNA-binding protein